MSKEMRQFFRMEDLDEQQLGMIAYVLNSPAYEESFRPYLMTVRESMNAIWLDRSQARKNTLPDDYLAGAIASIDGLLKFFTVVLHETSMENIHEAMTQSDDQKYDVRVARGMSRPVVGLNQSASPQPYDPKEDF